MIVIRTKMNVLPEKRLEVLQTLRSMVGPIGREAGCNCYGVYYDTNDEKCFILIEEWESQEDLDRHIRSRRFGVLLGIKPLLSKPLDIQIHTILHTAGMEMIREIRQKTVKSSNWKAKKKEI